MNIVVRKGTKDDMPAVHALICELALFEKAPQEVTNTIEDMLVDGFGPHPVFFCLVAEENGVVYGTAVYHLKYSTWKGKGVYLDDIVVTEKMRGKGIGKLLFAEVIRDTKRMQAKQLHWQVLDWNEPAIRFYEKYKANFDAGWINCKLDQSQVENWL
ncbi:MAG: GNAT family N-acetyltransferase [Bacteroidetes bacterium]|nr:GNAT family N-acetyltransferase [Bacteroidota bacterium]